MVLPKSVILIVCLIVGIVLVGVAMNKKKDLSAEGMVIILNGPSSVGKSSIVKAFQAQQPTPWLGAGIDHLYVGVIPLHWLDDQPEHRAIMTTEERFDGQAMSVKAIFGPAGEKVIKGMHSAIAAYAHAGNNVVVDYIK